MLSSRGRDSAAPTPRKTVRRDKCFFVIIIVSSPVLPVLRDRSRGGRDWPSLHLERSAIDHAQNEGRPAIAASRHIAVDLPNGRRVDVIDSATQRKSHQFLGHRLHKLLTARE